MMFRRRIEWFWRSPWSAALITAMGALTGLIGSTESAQIKGTIFQPAWDGRPIEVGATAFWVALMLTSLAYSWRQFATDGSQRQAEERLIGRTETLEGLIRTLPPADFLDGFNKSYAQCSSLVHKLLEGEESNREVSTLESVLSVLLSTIAGLARHFDGEPPKAWYATNVMTFVDVASIGEEEERVMLFLGASLAERRAELRGCLLLRTEWSARVSDPRQPVTPDTQLRPLALPVPVSSEHGGKNRALPGAPFAYLSMEPNCHQDTSSMADTCIKEGDFLPSVVGELRDYFTPAKSPAIRSLVSMPIVSHRGECLGVLNIHADRIGILREPLAQPHFYNLMAPFIQMVAHVLRLLLLPPRHRNPLGGDGEGSRAGPSQAEIAD